MNLTTFVDVAIGLSVMYLGASLFVTILNEYIAQFFQLRANQLKKDLVTLIDDPTIVTALSKNPALAPFFVESASRLQVFFGWLKTARNVLAALWPSQRRKTVVPPGADPAPTGAAATTTPPAPGPSPSQKPASFVDPNVLAQQLVGSLRSGKDDLDSATSLLGALGSLPADSKSKAQLQALARTAGTNMDGFVQTVGAYLDRTLVAMGEGYKRKVQLISFGVGLVVAVAFNLDTLLVTSHLYRDKEARDAIVAVGMQLTEKASKDQFVKCGAMKKEARDKAAECDKFSGLADAVIGRNDTLAKLPIGWESWKEALASLTPYEPTAGMRKPEADTQSTDK